MTYIPLPSSWAPVGSITYKPWLNEQDADDVCFASINLFSEERFYPCSGRDTDPPPPVPPAAPVAPLLAAHVHGHSTRRNAGSLSSEKTTGSGPGSGTTAPSTASAAPAPAHIPADSLAAGLMGNTSTGTSSSHSDGDSDNLQRGGRNIINIAMTPLGPGPWDVQGRAKLSVKQREDLCKKASGELR